VTVNAPENQPAGQVPTTKQTVGRWLSIVLPLVLGFALIYYQYSQFTPKQLTQIKRYFVTADYFYIGLSLFIALFGFLSRGYRWKYSLSHMGYSSRFSNNVLAVCIGYFINLTIPRSGEISRALLVRKYDDIPFDKAFGTIVAERIVDFMIFLLFVLATLIFQFDVLKSFILATIPLRQLLWIGIGGAGFLAVLVWVWIYAEWTIIIRLKQKVSGLAEGIKSVFVMRDRWAFIGHSFFIWFTYFAMFYVTIYALPETSSIGIGACITAFVFGSLAIGFTNSGFGAYPLLIAQIFVLYGVPDTAGTAFGWLVWTSQTLLIIGLGLLSFALLPVVNRKK
jgi:uncharacterized protein (TIRG00374 family)